MSERPFPADHAQNGLSAATRDQSVDLEWLLRVLNRRKLIIVTVVVAVTGLIAFVSSQLTPVYTARAAVLVEPRQTRVVDLKSVVEELPQDEAMIQTQLKLLRSTSFARLAIGELQLIADPEFNIALQEEQPQGANKTDLATKLGEWLPASWAQMSSALQYLWPLARGSAEQVPRQPAGNESTGELTTPHTELDLAALALDRLIEDAGAGSGHSSKLKVASNYGPSSEPDEAPIIMQGVPSPEDEALLEMAVKRFQDALEVLPSGDSYVITIGFTSPDSKKAALIANRLAELYLEEQLDSKRVTTARAANWLKERISELRIQLLRAEEAVETYRVENELLGGQNGGTLTEQELATLNRDLIFARAEREEREARLRIARELTNRGESWEMFAEDMNSSLLANLRLEQVRLLREAAQLTQEYGPQHPKMIQLKADQADLEAKIDAEMQNIILGLTNQVTVVRTREQAIQEQLRLAKMQSAEHNRAEVQLRQLQREAESTRTLYTAFLNRYKELGEQQDLLEPGVRIISTALVPDEPSFPRLKFMTAVGFTGSLFLGTLLAFAVDRLDRGLRGARQIERVLGIPHLAFVPKVGGLKRRQPLHHYLLDTPQSAYAEALRTVLSALSFSNVDQPPQVVLVTSSLPDEGKSTLALSLGAASARAGNKTVVVDFDLRRPSLHRYIRPAERRDGLVEFILEKRPLDQIIHHDDREDNLHLIPVRRMTGSPTEMLASKQIVSLLKELRERYSYVILDSPPLLGITDTRFAALLADAVLFVVRWQNTKEQPARNALRILQDSHAKVAGAVITQINVRRHRKFDAADVIHYYGKYRRYYVRQQPDSLMPPHR